MSVFANAASSSPEEIAAYVRALLGLLGEQDPLVVLRRTPDALRGALILDPRVVRAPEAEGKWSINQVKLYAAHDLLHLRQIDRIRAAAQTA